MSSTKTAWYLHASEELTDLTAEINKAPLLRGPVASAMTLLRMLKSCDVPPEEAHKIARIHLKLPEVMAKTGRLEAVTLTLQTLQDLNERRLEEHERIIPSDLS